MIGFYSFAKLTEGIRPKMKRQRQYQCQEPEESALSAPKEAKRNEDLWTRVLRSRKAKLSTVISASDVILTHSVDQGGKTKFTLIDGTTTEELGFSMIPSTCMTTRLVFDLNTGTLIGLHKFLKSGYAITVWDVLNDKVLHHGLQDRSISFVTVIAFSHEAKFVTADGYKHISIWDVSLGIVLFRHELEFVGRWMCIGPRNCMIYCNKIEFVVVDLEVNSISRIHSRKLMMGGNG